jgi:DNA-binding NarL/FixJ family response regulator
MPKILIIEDSAFERKAISGMLKDAGYSDLVEAESGEAGIKKFDESSPDLVLLDLRMPGMSGIDVLTELKKKKSSVKVLIVSIIRKKETIDEALSLGVKAYVTKPVTSAKLVPEVKKALSE